MAHAHGTAERTQPSRSNQLKRRSTARPGRATPARIIPPGRIWAAASPLCGGPTATGLYIVATASATAIPAAADPAMNRPPRINLELVTTGATATLLVSPASLSHTCRGMEGMGIRPLFGDARRTRGRVALDRNVRWFLFALTLVAIGLVGSNVIVHLGLFGLGQGDLAVPVWLDLDQEGSLPTYFQALMLTTLAWLSLRIGRLRWPTHSRDSAFWFVIAGALYYVSFDEVAGLHERTTDPVREAFGLSGVLYFSWVVPALVVLVILATICLRFILQMESRMRFLFVLAAILYVGGALGMELVGGYYFERDGFGTPMYTAAALVEESAEIAGILVLMYALFSQLGASVAVEPVPSTSITDPSTRVP